MQVKVLPWITAFEMLLILIVNDLIIVMPLFEKGRWLDYLGGIGHSQGLVAISVTWHLLAKPR